MSGSVKGNQHMAFIHRSEQSNNFLKRADVIGLLSSFDNETSLTWICEILRSSVAFVKISLVHNRVLASPEAKMKNRGI